MKKKFNWQSPLLNFLAVILGVYLAFYINENAKEKEAKQESLMWLKSVQNDIKGDIRTYENYQIPINQQHAANIDSLLQLLSEADMSSVTSLLPQVFQVENFGPTTSTYNSMKASGKIGLITDQALQKSIADYYENMAMESVEKGQFQVDYFTDELLTWMTYHIDLETMQVISEKELMVFKNKLILYGSTIQQKVKSYQNLVKESKELRDLIETHLESS